MDTFRHCTYYNIEPRMHNIFTQDMPIIGLSKKMNGLFLVVFSLILFGFMINVKLVHPRGNALLSNVWLYTKRLEVSEEVFLSSLHELRIFERYVGWN